MNDLLSLTKYEREFSPHLRQRVNDAERVADVQQAFAEFLRVILSRITGTQVVLDEGDVRVDPKVPDGFVLGPGLTEKHEYARFLEHSDFLAILRRQAKDAANRITHLERHTLRAEAKIFPRPDRKF
jgi:hypothetical protein